jgi:drug/metabolite transporter (DMT)-like permease
MPCSALRASRDRTRRLGWLVLILPPLFWAGNFAVGRAARDDVPPMMLAFARHFVALSFLLPFGWAAMRRDIRRYWECRWQLVRVSLTGMVAFNSLVYSGLHATTAFNAQLMNSAIPVLIVFLSGLLFGQRLRAAQVFGLALSCAGVLTIVLRGDFARLVALQLSGGDLIVFGAMVSFALFSVLLRSLPADMDRLGLLGAQLAIAVAMLLPAALWEYVIGGARATWNAAALAAMLYVGIAASLLANLLYMVGIARAGPARAGMFIHLVPVYGAIISTAWMGESPHVHHAIGMAAIMAGLACSNMTDAGEPDTSSGPPETTWRTATTAAAPHPAGSIPPGAPPR